MNYKIGHYVFNSSIAKLSAYLVLTSLLICLGFWQMSRATAKQQLLTQQQIQTTQVLKLTPKTVDHAQSLRYQPVQVSGRYDTAHQFLLDNQINQGKAGYFVLTPLILNDGLSAVLVNRGWLAAHPDRRILPAIDIQTREVNLAGRINTFPSVGIRLKGAEIPSENWPAVVQVIDTDVLSKKLGYRLFSFQVELDPAATQGYRRQWLENTLMLPQQHRAYAVQWFSLALTLTLLFFWSSVNKQINDTHFSPTTKKP
jgi:surfeit locus 1 family protein